MSLINRFSFTDSISVILANICAGALLGLFAKMIDGTIFGNIGTRLGVWVFITTMLAIYSKTAKIAAVQSFFFLESMLISYYLYSAYLFGFFPTSYFLRWSMIAIITPIAGWIVWHARGRGWRAAISAALPIAMLVTEGYPIWYTYNWELAIDFVLALVLLRICSKECKQRIKIILLTAIICFLISKNGFIY